MPGGPGALPRRLFGTFLYGQKGTKKPPGEYPRSPRHRPPGDTPFVVYLRSDQTGLILPTVPALRLPLPSVYPQVLTVAKQRGKCLRFCRAAIRRSPPCRLCPFKRPAGVQWPTATSNPKPPVAAHGRSDSSTRPLDQNPEGDFSFTGHRSSSPGSVSESPPPRWTPQGGGPE